MDIQDIVQVLKQDAGPLPRQALEAAAAQRDEITPALLQIIADATQQAEELRQERPGAMEHVYAMYLLAQFREPRAYPAIVALVSLPGELPDNLLGDVITEDLPRILASVSCGDPSLMQALAENEDINEYVRDAGLRGLVVLVACGELSREEVLAYYQSLLRERLRREPALVWDCVVSCCADLYPEEVYGDIQQAYTDNLVEEGMIEFEDVESTLAEGKATALGRLQQRQFRLITDTIGELEQWAGFKPPPPAVREAMRAVHSAVKKQKQKAKHKRKMTKASRRKNRR